MKTMSVCPSNRAPRSYVYGRNDYETVLAFFWIVQQSYGKEDFDALNMSKRIS